MTSPLSERFPGTARFYVTPYLPSPSDPSGPPAARRYHYHDISPPSSTPQKATLLLLHGFPDFSYGWRNVITPLIVSGYRLIIPDMLGYGGSSAPEDLNSYSALSMNEDLKGLLDHARAGESCKYGKCGADGKGGKVVVIGHDWGSFLAWVFARQASERVMGVSGVCVPYPVPHKKLLDINTIVKLLPNFGYQAFFANSASTKKIEENLALFFSLTYRAPGLFTGLDPSNDPFGTPVAERDSTNWVLPGRLEKLLNNGKLPKEAEIGASVLTDQEMKVYLNQFEGKNRMNGPLNWYRTRAINFEDEKDLATPNLPATLPAQLQMAELDAALPLSMRESTKKYVPSVRMDVLRGCGHWAMAEIPGTVVLNLKNWLDEDVWKNEDRTWLEKLGVKL